MSLVSGGKVLHLPGISSLPAAEKQQRKTWYPWLSILAFVFLFTLSLSALVFLEYKHVELQESLGRGPTDDGGYQLSKTAGAQWGIAWAGVASIMIPTAIGYYVAYKTSFGKKGFARVFLPILCGSIIFVVPYFLSGLIASESSVKKPSFSEWAKDKYSLSAIDLYTEKLVIKAKDQDHHPVEFNVFKSADNVVYLYRNEEELRNLLTERVAHNETKN